MKVTVDFLYNKLPEVYRIQDAKLNYPLKGFLSVLVEGGFQLLETDITNFGDIFNPDKCPKAFLPFLSAILGFEFPFDMSEKVQRRLLKNISNIYRLMGTKDALSFLINEITGFDSVIDNEDFIARSFDVSCDADGMDPYLTDKMDKIVYLLDKYKPVGSSYSLVFSLFYAETIPIEEKSGWDYDYVDRAIIYADEDASSILVGITEEIINIYKEGAFDEQITAVSPRLYERTILNDDRFHLNSNFVLNQCDRRDILKQGGVVIQTYTD